MRNQQAMQNQWLFLKMLCVAAHPSILSFQDSFSYCWRVVMQLLTPWQGMSLGKGSASEAVLSCLIFGFPNYYSSPICYIPSPFMLSLTAGEWVPVWMSLCLPYWKIAEEGVCFAMAHFNTVQVVQLKNLCPVDSSCAWCFFKAVLFGRMLDLTAGWH